MQTHFQSPCIPHVSVTLDPEGGYPSFTIQAADLAPAD